MKISLPFSAIKPIALALISLIISNSICQAQTDTTVATVNGRIITQKEIDASITFQLLPLQRQIFALRKASLNNYIQGLIIEAEAKRRGMSSESLKKELTIAKVEIAESDVDSAYNENASAFAQMSPDEAKQRLRLDMETQGRMRAYRTAVVKLRENAEITTTLKAPVLPVAISASDNVMGSPNAPVTLIEYADFRCLYCRNAYPVIKKIMQHYGESVRLVFKNLPLNENSELLAKSAFCAGEQGKFWQFHDRIFSDNKSTAESVAAELGLDGPKFQSCQTSQASHAAVRKDAQEAKNLGIDGTPAFLINGRLVNGFLSYEEFKSLIQEELKRVR